MLDQNKLFYNSFLVIVLSFVLLSLDKPNSGAMFFIAGLILLSLSLSIRPRVIQLQANRLSTPFSPEVAALNTQLKNDPAFQQAVMYAYDLNPTDFLTFGRLLVEMRDRADQDFLRDISSQFRREDK